MAAGAAFRVYIGQEKKNMLAEFDQWKKTHGEPRQAQKSLLCDAGKSIICSIELVSPEFASLQVNAWGLQNFLCPPQNGGFRACGKDTHHRDSASGDGANSARGLAKGVSEHLEGGIWETSEERESNCSGVQLAERGDWRVLLMLPFCWKGKMEIFGRRWRERQSL